MIMRTLWLFFQHHIKNLEPSDYDLNLRCVARSSPEILTNDNSDGRKYLISTKFPRCQTLLDCIAAIFLPTTRFTYAPGTDGTHSHMKSFY